LLAKNRCRALPPAAYTPGARPVRLQSRPFFLQSGAWAWLVLFPSRRRTSVVSVPIQVQKNKTCFYVPFSRERPSPLLAAAPERRFPNTVCPPFVPHEDRVRPRCCFSALPLTTLSLICLVSTSSPHPLLGCFAAFEIMVCRAFFYGRSIFATPNLFSLLAV